MKAKIYEYIISLNLLVFLRNLKLSNQWKENHTFDLNAKS